MTWRRFILRTIVLACAMHVSLATAASAAQFTLFPDADLATSGANDFLKPVAGCGSTTNVNRFDAIDEDVDGFLGAPCTEYVYGDTPGLPAATVWQEFQLSDPPAGAYTLNSLDVRVVACSTTAQDPDLTVTLYHGAGVLVDSKSVSSFNTCGAYSQNRLDFRDIALTRAQLATAYVRFTITKPLNDTAILRLAALNLDGTVCSANICGVARENITAVGPPWSRCPAAGVIIVRVNGVNPQAVACDVNGEFAYTGGAVNAGDIVTAYFADAGAPTHKGVTYYRADGTANTFEIFRDHVGIESSTSVPITNANINIWDGDNDAAWIPIVSDGTNVTESSPITILPAFSYSATGTYRPQGNVTVSSVVTRGELKADANTITLTAIGDSSTCSNPLGTRNPYCRNGSSIDEDTSTLRFTGAGQVGIPSQTYWNLVVAPSAGSFPVGASSITTSNDLTLGGGGGNAAWTTALTGTVTVGRDMTILAGSSFTGAGSQTIAVGRHFTGAGLLDLTSTSGEVRMRGTTAVRNFGPTVAGTTWRMPGLEVSTPGAASEVEVTTGGSGDIIVNGVMDVGQGTDTNVTTLDLNAFDRTFIVGGRLNITSRGTMLAPSSDTVELRNEFDRAGTFTPNGGTVQVNSTTDGIATLTYAAATTFANLTLQGGGTFQFDDVDQTNVTGNFSVNGSSCVVPTRASLVSVTAGSRWELNVTGTHTVSNASIQDSAAIAPLTGTLPSLDAGNNTGWTFTPGACLPQAPDTYLTETVAQPTTVIDATPEHSWINRAGYAVDQERTQVYTTLADGVVGLWRLDGNAQDSIGANHGAGQNGVNLSGTAQPAFGQAATFDGLDDRVSVPDAGVLDLTSNFTVETWVKTTSLNATDYATMLVKSNDAAGCTATSDCNYTLQYQGPFDRVCMKVIRGVTQYQSCGSSRAELNDGEWHHIAGTMTSGNELQLYVDGVATGASQNVAGPADTNAAAVAIGNNGGATSGFPGSLDDVRISSVARSAAEIRGYYRTVRPHYTVMWDSSPTDAGAALASCGDDLRCADVTYGTGGGELYLHNDGARYYVRSKVRNLADGVWSAWGSDWFEVQSSMNISATPAATLGTALPGVDAVATMTVNVDTNNFSGYTLTGSWNTQPMTRAGGATIPDFAPAVTGVPDPWAANAPLGFGVTVLGADTAGTPYPRLAQWGTGTDTAANDFVNNEYAGLAVGSPLLLHRRTTLDPGLDTIDLGLRGNVGSSQASGAYSSQLVLTAVANP